MSTAALPIVTDSIQSYLTEVSRYPVLSSEEEYEVAERYYREGEVEDAHALVTANLRYVVRIALEYRSYGCRLADLIQEGNMGLMKAVKKFNPYKGYRLITYATWWIRSHMQEFILKHKGIVRRGTKALKKKLFYRSRVPALASGEAADGEARAEAAATDATAALATSDLSLDVAIGDDGGTTHLDVLTDEGPGAEETYSDREESELVKEEVAGALAVLNDKERMVIHKRIMAEDPMSLQALGDVIGVTRERVRQIEAKALTKLQKALVGRPGARALLPGFAAG